MCNRIMKKQSIIISNIGRLTSCVFIEWFHRKFYISAIFLCLKKIIIILSYKSICQFSPNTKMSENSSQSDIIEIDLLLNLFNTSSKDIVIVNFIVSNMYKIYRNIYIGDYW